MSSAREVASTTMWATVMGSSGPPSAAVGTTCQCGHKQMRCTCGFQNSEKNLGSLCARRGLPSSPVYVLQEGCWVGS